MKINIHKSIQQAAQNGYSKTTQTVPKTVKEYPKLAAIGALAIIIPTAYYFRNPLINAIDIQRLSPTKSVSPLAPLETIVHFMADHQTAMIIGAALVTSIFELQLRFPTPF